MKILPLSEICVERDSDPAEQRKRLVSLLKAGAEIDAADKNGVTALHHAVRFRNPGAVRTLIEHGANVNQVCRRSGSTPLHRAVTAAGAPGTAGKRREALEIIRLLVEAGADPSVANKTGKKPIDYVKDEVIRSLLEALLKVRMNEEIKEFNKAQTKGEREICEVLAALIDRHLRGAESKIWHRHPVWFLDGNPTVGYSKLKAGIRLMFWSGADFGEEKLKPGTGKFKDASIVYTSASEVNERDLKRCLKKAKEIQWDYKNLMKNGKLVRLK